MFELKDALEGVKEGSRNRYRKAWKEVVDFSSLNSTQECPEQGIFIQQQSY